MLFAAVLVAAASAAIATASASAATVELRQTSRGMILVNSAGFTLYEFTSDTKNHDNCVMVNGCPEFWPPLEVMGAPTAGPGVKAKKLGAIMLPNGAMQVTYARHPLYGYIGDTMPGQTSYIGVEAFGGFWYGLTAKGRAVL
jgi:predicted lipoprotein with Yx(FWY)xxD motif